MGDKRFWSVNDRLSHEHKLQRAWRERDPAPFFLLILDPRLNAALSLASFADRRGQGLKRRIKHFPILQPQNGGLSRLFSVGGSTPCRYPGSTCAGGLDSGENLAARCPSEEGLLSSSPLPMEDEVFYCRFIEFIVCHCSSSPISLFVFPLPRIKLVLIS